MKWPKFLKIETLDMNFCFFFFNTESALIKKKTLKFLFLNFNALSHFISFFLSISSYLYMNKSVDKRQKNFKEKKTR